MRILFQLRLGLMCLLLGIAAGCGRAPKPTEPFAEAAPDPSETEHEGIEGVLKLAPWPTLLVMEAGDDGDLHETPIGLVTLDWKALEDNVDLRKLNDKLVELKGTSVFSGPARVFQVAPGSLGELEGSFGTPGRAAEDKPVALGETELKGRIFTLPFLARNGPRLPDPGEESALAAQRRELEAGLPVVLLLDKGERPADFKSPLLFLTGLQFRNLPAKVLDPVINREATVSGVPEVQGSWQVMRLTSDPRPVENPSAPDAQP